VSTPLPSVAGGKLTILCVGGTVGQICKVVMRLTTKETLKGKKIVGLAARTKTVVVGTATTTIETGKTRAISVKLNRTGRKLLAMFGKLPVKAAIRLVDASGKTLTTITTKFTIRKRKH
jgi:hypothetical protein